MKTTTDSRAEVPNSHERRDVVVLPTLDELADVGAQEAQAAEARGAAPNDDQAQAQRGAPADPADPPHARSETSNKRKNTERAGASTSAREGGAGQKRRNTGGAQKAAPARKPMIITPYTFKGGAGKTTFVMNLAATFTNQGYTVLMVDMDPQANLTTFFNTFATKLGEQDDDGEEKDEEDEEDEEAAAAVNAPFETLNDIFFQQRNATVDGSRTPTRRAADKAMNSFSNSQPDDYVLSMRLHPNVFPLDVSQAGSLNFKVDGEEFTSTVFSKDSPLYKLMMEVAPGSDFHFNALSLSKIADGFPEDKLYLVPGTSTLQKAESVLQKAEQSLSDVPAQSLRFLGAIRAALLKTAEKVGAQFVIVDVGPSIGALNRNIVLNSDVIVPQAFPDTFSAGSLYHLFHTVLSDWFRKDHGKWCEAAEEEQFEFKRDLPFVCPVVVNNYLAGKITQREAAVTLADPTKYHLKSSDLSGDFVKQASSMFCELIERIVSPQERAHDYSKIVKARFLSLRIDNPTVGDTAYTQSRSISYAGPCTEASRRVTTAATRSFFFRTTSSRTCIPQRRTTRAGGGTRHRAVGGATATTPSKSTPPSRNTSSTTRSCVRSATRVRARVRARVRQLRPLFKRIIL